MSILSASPGVSDHLQNLAENMVTEGFVKIDGEAMAIVGRQAQTDTDTVDFDACAGIIFLNHVFQVVVEVELVVGKIGGAVHRTAVGNAPPPILRQPTSINFSGDNRFSEEFSSST